MEPEQEPEAPKEVSRGRLIWRMILLPVAFAWVAFLLFAPLAIIDDRFGWGALAFGLSFGIALLIVQPAWVKKVLSAPVDDPPRRIRTAQNAPLGIKLAMTGVSLLVASATGWFLLNSDFKERSIFAVLAVLIVIDMIRRPLRRAWGLPGSVAGITISGALIVLLLRAASDGVPDSSFPIIAGILLLFEIFEEYRARRGVADSHQTTYGDQRKHHPNDAVAC